MCLRSASRYQRGERRVTTTDRARRDVFLSRTSCSASTSQRMDASDEARSLAERGFAIAPWFKPMVGLLAAVLMRGERQTAPNCCFRGRCRLNRGTSIRSAPPCSISCPGTSISLRIGEGLIEERQFAVMFFLRSHGRVMLRASARWPALARMMNLPGWRAPSPGKVTSYFSNSNEIVRRPDTNKRARSPAILSVPTPGSVPRTCGYQLPPVQQRAAASTTALGSSSDGEKAT